MGRNQDLTLPNEALKARKQGSMSPINFKGRSNMLNSESNNSEDAPIIIEHHSSVNVGSQSLTIQQRREGLKVLTNTTSKDVNRRENTDSDFFNLTEDQS